MKDILSNIPPSSLSSEWSLKSIALIRKYSGNTIKLIDDPEYNLEEFMYFIEEFSKEVRWRMTPQESAILDDLKKKFQAWHDTGMDLSEHVWLFMFGTLELMDYLNFLLVCYGNDQFNELTLGSQTKAKTEDRFQRFIIFAKRFGINEMVIERWQGVLSLKKKEELLSFIWIYPNAHSAA